MLSSNSPDRPRADPTPYDLYIRLAKLEALWPAPGAPADEVVVTCGFQAAELTLRLMEDALGDERVAAFPEQRVRRYAEHLIGGVELICDLLKDLPALSLAPRSSEHALDDSPGFRVLGRLEGELLDALTRRLLLATGKLPFDTGIEHQLERVRREQGLEPGRATRRGQVPAVDYRRLVAPEAVRGLREASPCGPEDHLFSTAHQITECWLKIAHHYLTAALVWAEARSFQQAADALTRANAVLPLVIQAGQLLDQMVLADYHPLRVRLRDGSGAQSSRARRLGPAVRDVAEALWAALAATQLSVVEVLDRPAEHFELYGLLCALKNAGKLAQSFLFHHYLLTLGVLGTHSLGSLGYEIRELAERAAQPLLPEINQAHHDYVMLTNFEHGRRSGSIVYGNELAHGGDPYGLPHSAQETCPRSIVEARVGAYFRAIETRDADAWVALFHPTHGQLHDVTGTRPYLGERRLRVFINGMFRAFSEMRASLSPPRIDGNAALVDWRFEASSYHGVPTLLEGREEFLFDAEGRIVKAIAHWEPELVARQWRSADAALASVARHPHSYIADLAPTAARSRRDGAARK